MKVKRPRLEVGAFSTCTVGVYRAGPATTTGRAAQYPSHYCLLSNPFRVHSGASATGSGRGTAATGPQSGERGPRWSERADAGVMRQCVNTQARPEPNMGTLYGRAGGSDLPCPRMMRMARALRRPIPDAGRLVVRKAGSSMGTLCLSTTLKPSSVPEYESGTETRMIKKRRGEGSPTTEVVDPRTLRVGRHLSR